MSLTFFLIFNFYSHLLKKKQAVNVMNNRYNDVRDIGGTEPSGIGRIEPSGIGRTEPSGTSC